MKSLNIVMGILFLSIFLSPQAQAAKDKERDRTAAIEAYLAEFCSLQEQSMIFTAIKNVLRKMPYKDFLNVTNRRRPVLFVEVYDSGTARFASSQEFIVSKNDPPCCQEGFTLIKLGGALEESQDNVAIAGVVAHELAHRVLEHIKKGKVSCKSEREANRLIKRWGFEKEFAAASKAFGHRKGDPVSCQDK